METQNETTKEEALEGAVEMLTKIMSGGSYPMIDFINRVQEYERALCDMRSDSMIRMVRNRNGMPRGQA